MATNYKNTNIEIITTKRPVPAVAYSTGTVTKGASGVVGNTSLTFAGGASTATMVVGGWIYIAALTEVRRIVSKVDGSTTVLHIDYDFSGAVAASAYGYIPPSAILEIAWLVMSTGNAAIDGVTVPANSYGAFGKNSVTREARQDFINPVIFDGTTTNIIVTTLK